MSKGHKEIVLKERSLRQRQRRTDASSTPLALSRETRPTQWFNFLTEAFSVDG
ncbi:hypothetical protein GS682_09695 [Nostoc sp. B(2019)]|nr:hypothetical protein [Nostoc sp. B(2019)]